MTDLAEKKLDLTWDDNPIDITSEANMIWGIANKLRGLYMPDHYGDVIIPMTILRRFECTLEATKDKVIKKFESDPETPSMILERESGYQFYNTSRFNLKELLNDDAHILSNFKSYLDGFSANVQTIFKKDSLGLYEHAEKMATGGCLYNVIEAFSDLDLHPAHFDSIKMGYIFENLIGRFFQNVDAGQYYTGRDIIKLMVSLLISEGADDIFEDRKVINICDQACGTGGMLSTAYSYLKHFNPTCDINLYGVEVMPQTHAIGLAEMLIKGQNAKNFVNADTFKTDPFPNQKMRFVIENPPFGVSWGGKDAKEGQEKAVKAEFAKGFDGRWGAGLPGTSDGQLLFVQSAVDKLNDNNGRAAIIENGSPLFTGGTSSGESQVRRWLLENDLIEAIIQMPTDLFYNTGISTYIWLISKNKRPERRGYVQLIDASSISHKLRKPLGNKKNEFLPDDRLKITKLYTDFKENEYCKIFKNTEFIYREYTVMQPLQRSYSITEKSIENLIQKNVLSSLWDEAKVQELEDLGVTIDAKDKKNLDAYYETKPLYEEIIEKLKDNISEEKYLSPEPFETVVANILKDINLDVLLKDRNGKKLDGKEKEKKDKEKRKALITKVVEGLSVMDKTAEIQKDKKGDILYDTETKDSEIVKWDEDINDYMKREVLPHVPDAKWFWEENPNAKKPVVKTGAEIPFTRYFYKYQAPTPSDELLSQIKDLESSINERMATLLGGN